MSDETKIENVEGDVNQGDQGAPSEQDSTPQSEPDTGGDEGGDSSEE